MESTFNRVWPWIFGGLFLLGYLLAMTVFYDRLPEQWGIDSTYLQDLMTQGSALEADSFSATAQLMGLIPAGLLQGIIALLGFVIIVLFSGASRTITAGFGSGVLLAPVLLMGLLRPQKEVLVVAMVLAVLATVWRSKNSWLPLVVLAILYGLYGFYVRPYYLLILAVFGALYGLPRCPKWLVVLLVGVAICALWLLPVDIFMNLQGVRDDQNFERIVGEIGNRTFFFNPLKVTSAGAFLVNYAYAAVRLNVPVLFSFAPQEWYLTLTSLLYGALVWGMMKFGEARERLLAALFLAHLLVLWLFEPDLGSYLRHASSAMAYLWPGLILWQERRD